jgi:hypothetical protein
MQLILRESLGAPAATAVEPESGAPWVGPVLDGLLHLLGDGGASIVHVDD